MKKKVTEFDDYLREVYQTATVADMQKHTGCGATWVRLRLVALGLKRPDDVIRKLQRTRNQPEVPKVYVKKEKPTKPKPLSKPNPPKKKAATPVSTPKRARVYPNRDLDLKNKVSVRLNHKTFILIDRNANPDTAIQPYKHLANEQTTKT